MKKIIWITGLVVLVLGVGLYFQQTKTNLLAAFSSEPELKDVNTAYEVDVEVFPEKKKVKGSVKIFTKNDTGKEQDEVYFQILANKFKDLDKLEGEAWKKYLGPFSEPGGFDFSKITVNGEETDYLVEDTMLKIPLESWEENETIELKMEYTLTIPFTKGIFSYTESNIYFAYWLPTRAVYEKDGWYMNEFDPVGDSGYYDIGNYKVEVTVPKDYQIASTGIETSPPEVDEKKKTYEMEANKVRTFAMSVMDKTYKSISREVDGITVRSWYTPESKLSAKDFNDVAVESFEYFNKSFGKYPYKEFDIVPGPRSNVFLGMEYPGLTVVHNDYYVKRWDFFNEVIAHEIAHQWWYGVVGNHTLEEPWLDESVTSYVTVQFLNEYYPAVGYDKLRSYRKRMEELPELTKDGTSLTTSTSEFPHDLYGPFIYAIGPQMFYQLEQEIGVEKMNEALSHYYEKNAYKIATKEDLLRSFKKIVGPETEEYFKQWFNNNPVEYSEVQ